MTQRPEPPTSEQKVLDIGATASHIAQSTGNLVGIPVTFEKLSDIPVYAVHQTGGAPIPVLSGVSPILVPTIPSSPTQPAAVPPVPTVPTVPEQKREPEVKRGPPPEPPHLPQQQELPKPIAPPPEIPKLKLEPEKLPKPVVEESTGPVFSTVIPTTLHPFGKVCTVVTPLETDIVKPVKEHVEKSSSTTKKQSHHEEHRKTTRESETRVTSKDPPKEETERSPTEEELK